VSAIYDALIRLNEKVIGLEKSAEIPLAKVQMLNDKLAAAKKSAGAAKKGQPDLFSVGSAPANKNIGFDTGMLARKLDIAIQKVEQVLKEG
jgi:hypothetical protein